MRSSIRHSRMFLSGIQILCFILNLFGPLPIAKADELLLPKPGAMVTISSAFSPAIITGMTIHPNNPLQFDFIVDMGDNHLQGEALKKESQKLINYFVATLTVPEDEMWVNLSPYEKNRIIADGLGNTEMGRDMLAQDYILKQLTASLIYPESNLGKEFWQKIYAKAKEQFGTTEVPTNLFNKVWIVPQDATVYVNGKNVFVTGSHLKVMLEQDYFALETNQGSNKHGLGNISKNDIKTIGVNSARIIREILLPEIEKEVNEGNNFSNLRQIYNSMILATWYKKKLKSSLLSKIYLDKNKTNGIELNDKTIKEKIYRQYLSAYKKGVYNYIKEDYDLQTQEVLPRKYFSGGLKGPKNIAEGHLSTKWLQWQRTRDFATVSVNAELVDKAMIDEPGEETDGIHSDQVRRWEEEFQVDLVNPIIKPEYEITSLARDLVTQRMLSPGANILTFGAYMGFDEMYFARNGFHVLATDFIKPPLDRLKQLAEANGIGDKIDVHTQDLTKPIVFETSFDVIEASQSIFYLDDETLRERIREMHQVLKPGGVIAISVRSIKDKRYVEAEHREGEFILRRGTRQRYFSVESLRDFFEPFFNNIRIIERTPFERYRGEGDVNFIDLFAVKKDINSPTGVKAQDVDDKAMNAPGGIDLNSNNLNLKEQGQELAFNFSFKNFHNVQPAAVKGVLPIITNISTVVDFSSLLQPAAASSN